MEPSPYELSTRNGIITWAHLHYGVTTHMLNITAPNARGMTPSMVPNEVKKRSRYRLNKQLIPTDLTAPLPLKCTKHQSIRPSPVRAQDINSYTAFLECIAHK